MTKRERLILVVTAVVAIGGFVGTIYFGILVGLLSLLLLAFLIVALQVLQHRQLSLLQKRTLLLLRQVNSTKTATPKTITKQSRADVQAVTLSTKKIVGLLQAQQISMDLLNQKFQSLVEKE